LEIGEGPADETAAAPALHLALCKFVGALDHDAEIKLGADAGLETRYCEGESIAIANRPCNPG
jgi:hypothetical protein